MDMLRRIGLILVAATAAACATAPTPSAAPTPSPTLPSTVQPTPTPEPTVQVSCLVNPAEPPLNDDPCPAGVAAVRAVTATYGTPTRIALLPGPFLCGDMFPPASPAIACFPPIIISGTSMHAWVAFAGTPKVAAVQLRRAMTFDGGKPVGTPGPWEASVVEFQVPPATFVMP